MTKKTLYVEIGEEDLGIIYADPENQKEGLADFTIVDAPDDLKSEIGCLVRLPLNEMKIFKKAK
tara:strand:- start:478 stop:669 length:192 start_codon:yes stop_codon:yes gene_type:complete